MSNDLSRKIQSKECDKLQIIEDDINGGKIWNYLLGIITSLNVLILVIYFIKNYSKSSFNLYTFILVIIYAVVCCIRSLYPVVESSCKCLNDSRFIKPFVTRSLATIAEISFSILVAIVFINIGKELYKRTKHEKYRRLEIGFKLFVIFIIIAQANCWAGIITQNALYNTIEESIWTVFGSYILIASALMLLSVYSIKSINGKLNSIKFFLISSISVSLGYVIFMIMVDVPMYYNRFRNDKIEKKSLSHKVKQLFSCEIVTTKYSDWSEEMPWMSLYFVFAVWATMFMYYFNNKVTKK